MSATRTLAQFIVDTRYDQLPAPVVEAAKVAILDGVATMLGGSTQDLASIIGQYVKDLGGTPHGVGILDAATISVGGIDRAARHQRGEVGRRDALAAEPPQLVNPGVERARRAAKRCLRGAGSDDQ